MAKRKPPKKDLSREDIQKKVNRMRSMMKIVYPKAFPDLNSPKLDGKYKVYDTENGRVGALTYGFEKNEKLPLLVNIHGSGFTMGNAGMDDEHMMQFVEKCNVKVLSIDYTLAPEAMFPAALNQCYALIKYAKNNAEELGIDSDRIVIMGHSAGGNFCAGICLMENEKRALGIKGLILDYPPTDISIDPYDKPSPKGCLNPKMCRLFDAAYVSSEETKNPLVSPALATKDMVCNFPPTLVITASQDSLSFETERLKDTLISAGVDVKFKRFEGQKHAFTGSAHDKKMSPAKAAALEAWQMMVDFVNEHI